MKNFEISSNDFDQSEERQYFLQSDDELMFIDESKPQLFMPYDREYDAFMTSSYELSSDKHFPFPFEDKIDSHVESIQNVDFTSLANPGVNVNDSANIIQECSYESNKDDDSKSEEQPSSTESTTNAQGQSRARRETRWKYEQDVELAKIIKALIRFTSLTFDHLKVGRGRISHELNWLLSTAKVQAGWKGTIYELRTRISTKLNRTNFTAREQRKVMRNLREYFKGELSLQNLLENFPWKTKEQIFRYAQ